MTEIRVLMGLHKKDWRAEVVSYASRQKYSVDAVSQENGLYIRPSGGDYTHFVVSPEFLARGYAPTLNTVLRANKLARECKGRKATLLFLTEHVEHFNALRANELDVCIFCPPTKVIFEAFFGGKSGNPIQ